jgi:transposase InsO family protein
MRLYEDPIATGAQFGRNDGHYTVISISHESLEAILERHSDRTRLRLPIHELRGEVFRGQALPYDVEGQRLGEPSFKQDIVGLSGEAQVEFEVRSAYCRKLLQLPAYGPNNTIFQSAVDELHAELTQAHKKNKQFHYFWTRKYGYWTVYGWCKLVRKHNGDLSVLAMRHPTLRKPTQRLHTEVKKIITAVLDEIDEEYDDYIKRQRRGEEGNAPEVTYRHIERQVKGAIERLKANTGLELPIPAFETIRKHASQRSRLKQLTAMYGRHVAKKELGPYGQSFKVTRILQRAEMDFFHGDIILVANHDGMRVALGIPHLSVIIDVFSRAILACVVEFSVPNSSTVLSAIKQMLLPKTDIWERYPSIKTRVDYFGPPEAIAYDNAWVFDSRDLKAALGEFHIFMHPSHIKTPMNKPHIESFGKSLNVKLHRLLPGHKKSIGESRRYEYNPSKMPVMELDEFIEKLNRFIYDSYSNSAHSGLNGLSPRNAWQHSLARMTGSPDAPLFPMSKIEVDFKVALRHQIEATRKGIELHTREYRSPELTELFVTNPSGTKFDVREDPLDINHILVVDPRTGHPITVPSAAPYPVNLTGKSFAELRTCIASQAEIDHVLVADTERDMRRESLLGSSAATVLSRPEMELAKVLAAPGVSELLVQMANQIQQSAPVTVESEKDLIKGVWGDQMGESSV